MKVKTLRSNVCGVLKCAFWIQYIHIYVMHHQPKNCCFEPHGRWEFQIFYFCSETLFIFWTKSQWEDRSKCLAEHHPNANNVTRWTVNKQGNPSFQITWALVLLFDDEVRSRCRSEQQISGWSLGFSFSDWKTKFSLILSPGLRIRLMRMQLCSQRRSRPDGTRSHTITEQTVKAQQDTNKTTVTKPLQQGTKLTG